MRPIAPGLLLAAVVASLAFGSVACSAAAAEPAPEVEMRGTCPKAITGALGDHSGAGMADKTLALTFDDGPSESTAELSRYLAANGVPSTFFINGANVDGFEDVLDRQVADGHLLANHTHTHTSLLELGPSDIVDEVAATDRLLTGRVPAGKLYFRPPFGDWSADVAAALSTSAMNKYRGPIGWDIGDSLTDSTAADWDCWDDQGGRRSVEQCGDLYLDEIHAKGRGIVLMHDGPPNGNGSKTVAMVKYLVPKLKAEGFTFLRVDHVFEPPQAAVASGASPDGAQKAPVGGASAGPAGSGASSSERGPASPCR